MVMRSAIAIAHAYFCIIAHTAAASRMIEIAAFEGIEDLGIVCTHNLSKHVADLFLRPGQACLGSLVKPMLNFGHWVAVLIAASRIQREFAVLCRMNVVVGAQTCSAASGTLAPIADYIVAQQNLALLIVQPQRRAAGVLPDAQIMARIGLILRT